MKSLILIMLPVFVLSAVQPASAQQLKVSNASFFTVEEYDEMEKKSNMLRFMVKLEQSSLTDLELNSLKYNKYFTLNINSYSFITDTEFNVAFKSNNNSEKKMLYKLCKKHAIKQIRYKDTFYSTEEFFKKHVYNI